MIRKFIDNLRECADEFLRGMLGRLTPERRVILILTMLVVFGIGSFYITVSSFYNLGKNKGKELQIRHIEQLKLELKQNGFLLNPDSINHQLKKLEYGK